MSGLFHLAPVFVPRRFSTGCIITQGHGRIGSYDASVASMMRYGELSSDEYFVSEQSARVGVEFINPSKTEPLVLLKHFGPNAGDPALG